MLTSAHNPRLQRVRALLEKRRQRELEQAFVVEGVRLAEEGLASGWEAQLVLFTGSLSGRGQAVVEGLRQKGAETWQVPEKWMDSSAGTETPQGLLAVFSRPPVTLPARADFVLVVDNLRDPGNLGTLLRSAVAAGAQAALLSPGTADAYAPKVLRAGMGAHFRLPILTMAWSAIRGACQAGIGQPLAILLADSAGGIPCWEIDLQRPLALIIGSEADGPSPEARALAGEVVTIPMPGKSESLNAAVAAGVLLFEVVRQRRYGHGEAARGNNSLLGSQA